MLSVRLNFQDWPPFLTALGHCTPIPQPPSRNSTQETQGACSITPLQKTGLQKYEPTPVEVPSFKCPPDSRLFSPLRGSLDKYAPPQIETHSFECPKFLGTSKPGKQEFRQSQEVANNFTSSWFEPPAEQSPEVEGIILPRVLINKFQNSKSPERIWRSVNEFADDLDVLNPWYKFSQVCSNLMSSKHVYLIRVRLDVLTAVATL